MINPLEVDENRYQGGDEYIYAKDPKLRNDQRRLAAFIGLAAIGMPIVLALGGSILGNFDLGEFRKSLSGFYYEEVVLGDIFVGTLIFIGTAMFVYRGWHPKIALLATIGGLCAFLVALFPADGWFIVDDGRQIFEEGSDRIHFWAAVALFAILAWFCFFVFTKVEPHQRDTDGKLLPTKRNRNMFYRFSGTIIVLSVAAIGIGETIDPDWATRIRLTYWGETIALVAFGVSWLVQGRAFGTLAQDPRDQLDEAVAEASEG